MTTAALVAATALLVSTASPAIGVPTLSRLSRSVARALKLSKGADTRSRKALKLAQTADTRSRSALALAQQPGPAGAPGTPAAASGPTVLDFRADPGDSRPIYDRGGLLVTATCSAGPTIDVVAQTRVDHAILHVSTSTAASAAVPATTTLVQKNDFLVGGAPQTLASTGHLQGTATYSTPTGVLTTLVFGAEQGAFGGGTPAGCWFGGTAETNG
jgi:hypothetical protein